MTSPETPPPAGWYPDAGVPGGVRWWDGVAWSENRRAAEPSSPPQADPEQYVIPDSRYINTEVAGEAWRDAEIQAALGRRIRVDEEIEEFRPASLVPEPDNPHDPNAISVRISEQVVGYIPRDEAPQHLLAIKRITASGYVATTDSRIWAVKRTGYDNGPRVHSAIRIALPWGGIKLPINNPPNACYSLLPWGGAVQISGEADHFDHIRQYVPSSGDGLLIVTLHRANRELKSGQTREIVEVRLDGERVGELSTTTSRHFLPTIDHLADKRVQVAAYARIQGSKLSAEIKVQGAKASELPNDWLDGLPVRIPPLLPEADHYDVPDAYVPQRSSPLKGQSKMRVQEYGKLVAKPANKGGCAIVLVSLIGATTAVTAGAAHLLL